MFKLDTVVRFVYNRIFAVRRRVRNIELLLKDVRKDVLGSRDGVRRRLDEVERGLERRLDQKIGELANRSMERDEFLFQSIKTIQRDLKTQLARYGSDVEAHRLQLKNDMLKIAAGDVKRIEAIQKTIGTLQDHLQAVRQQLRDQDFLREAGKVFQAPSYKMRRIPKLKDVFNDYPVMVPDDSLFKLWDYELSFIDGKSLWIQLNELILREEYYFSEDLDAPHRILDCGSNIGLSILFFKARYPNSTVIGFEPDETCYRIALDNVTRNGLTDVTLEKAAVGVENCTANLFVNPADSMGASLRPRHMSDAVQQHAIEVRTVSLDGYLEQPVDFLKLDIEGSECEVLGALGSKLKNAHYIFCEYHFGEESRANSLRDIIDVLDDNGFDYQLAKSVWFSDRSEYRPMTFVGDSYSGVIYAKNRNWLLDRKTDA